MSKMNARRYYLERYYLKLIPLVAKMPKVKRLHYNLMKNPSKLTYTIFYKKLYERPIFWKTGVTETLGPVGI